MAEQAVSEKSVRKPTLKFDFEWGTTEVYVLDAFDSLPMIGKRDRSWYGPGLIVVERHKASGQITSTEHFLADPKIWEWIVRSIANGKQVESPPLISGAELEKWRNEQVRKLKQWQENQE